MPIIHGRGVSKTTIIKETGLEHILHQHFSIIQAIEKKYKRHPNWVKSNGACYRYIDCCSGTGLNPEYTKADGSPLDGSPKIFLDTIEKYNISWRASFIEMDHSNHNELYKNLKPWEQHFKHGKFEVIAGDYNEELFPIINKIPSIQERNPMKIFGLVYFDPNSFPNWDLVKNLSNHPKMKYIDILIHCSSTSTKRVKGAKPDLFLFLDDYVTQINKKQCLIRELIPGDPHQMTFLFLTNMPDYKAMNSQGLYDIHSHHGKKIIRECSYTKEQLLNHPQSKESLNAWLK